MKRAPGPQLEGPMTLMDGQGQTYDHMAARDLFFDHDSNSLETLFDGNANYIETIFT